MVSIERRHFLQFAGATLAAIGLKQLDIIGQGDRYGKILAQNTSRKLALLVGINDYPKPLSSLRGCLTDIEMQRELLVNRFGFKSQDIEIITDETKIKPTRAGILQAFEEHLIDNAKPGDVVVFHYSGHGSQVIDPDPIPTFKGLNGTIIPYDSLTNVSANSRTVQDIMGKTLFLLTSALKTEQFTMILDSCHSGGGTRGNFVFRAINSRYGTQTPQPSSEELAYQQQWISKLGLSADELKQKRQRGIAKGVALGSARSEQFAADVPFGDFHAGAFSYLLTRYLWQQSQDRALKKIFVNLARRTRDLANSSGVTQDPIYEVKPGSDYDRQSIFFTKTVVPAAEAVVRAVEGEQVEFWLGGISSQSLKSFETGAIFSIINARGITIGQIEQTSRSGLIGKGKLLKGQVEEGNLLREKIRGIPSNLKLSLGIDPSLGSDSTSVRRALENESRIEVITLDRQKSVDYIFGRITSEILAQTKVRDPGFQASPGNLGLFTAGLLPVHDSFSDTQESINQALNRLRPRLTTLLAGKILSLVLNSDTSKLNVQFQVVVKGTRAVLENSSSRGSKESPIIPLTISNTSSKLKAGNEIQVQVENQETKNLYLGLLAIGNQGDITLLHPLNWDSAEDEALLASKQKIVLPLQERDFRFRVQGPAGFFELLLLASTEPLRDALKGLKQIAQSRGIRKGDPLSLDRDASLSVMDALLSDLDRHTRAGVAVTRGPMAIDTSIMAALSAIIEVVD